MVQCCTAHLSLARRLRKSSQPAIACTASHCMTCQAWSEVEERAPGQRQQRVRIGGRVLAHAQPLSPHCLELMWVADRAFGLLSAENETGSALTTRCPLFGPPHPSQHPCPTPLNPTQPQHPHLLQDFPARPLPADSLAAHEPGREPAGQGLPAGCRSRSHGCVGEDLQARAHHGLGNGAHRWAHRCQGLLANHAIDAGFNSPCQPLSPHCP